MSEEKRIHTALWLLRVGLAFVYAYASVAIYFNPESFTKYIPPSMQSMMPMDLFLIVFGVAEVLLVIWLLSGKRTEYAGIISAVIMMSIVLTNITYFSILFRNVCIAFASVALFILEYKPKPKSDPTMLG